MYGKCTLFYESPKNRGYLRTCTNSVYQASPRGEGPGNEARVSGHNIDRHITPGKTFPITTDIENCFIKFV